MGQEGRLARPRKGGKVVDHTCPLPFVPTCLATVSFPFFSPIYSGHVEGGEHTTQFPRTPLPQGAFSLEFSLPRAVPRRAAHKGSLLHPVRGSAARIRIHKIYLRTYAGSANRESSSFITVRLWNCKVLYLWHLASYEENWTRLWGRRGVQLHHSGTSTSFIWYATETISVTTLLLDRSRQLEFAIYNYFCFLLRAPTYFPRG
jgi:hypothetical protein